MDFKLEIAKKISSLVDMDSDKIMELIEIPPQSNMGDYAFPCFQLAKVMRKSPNMITAELSGKLQGDDVLEKAEAAGGYLNFFINKKEYIKELVGEVLEKGEKFGSSSEGADKNVIVEFSSVNVAKPFHVGHLFNTMLGSALEKVYKHSGYNTIKINHLGDWGTQFGKLIVAYKNWIDEAALEKAPITELFRIYVKFHEEAEKNPALEDEARAYFKKLEDGDPEVTELWQRFKDLSLREFNEIYRDLNVEFDSYAGESFYSDKMDEVVQMLRDKKLLVDSNGARIVDLEQFGIPPIMILKSDGATIYATRDLAAAIYRKRHYNFYKNIYVVGGTQSLHFNQIFSTLGLMGFEWSKDCVHIGHGLVKFADKKLSTRKGDVVFAKDVMNEAIHKTLEVIENKNPNLENKADVARKVGMGALIYTFLKNNREKDVVFTWEDALNFDGDSGPYVQYTYVRGRSILRKAGNVPDTADLSYLSTEDEFQLVKLLGAFKDAVREAAERYEPFVVIRHVTEIAKAYNKFYNTHPILNAEENVKNARLQLTKAVGIVIKTGLGLAGIETPENM
ncbi:MAG TPA: arginine--tRNA ligase [Negativicutes bacterium]|nr:arginine--tRNA ligase [Negativicutes bacterium]